MRICLIGPTEASEDSSGEAFAALFRPSFDKMLRPDTEVVPKNLKAALRTDYPRDFTYPYFVFLDTRSIMEAFIEAENEGFDAAWINFFADAGVNEARSVVSIPVAGPAESTMLLACQLGHKFGMVAPNMPGDQLPPGDSQVASSGGRMQRHENAKGPFLEVLMKGIGNPSFVVEEGKIGNLEQLRQVCMYVEPRYAMTYQNYPGVLPKVKVTMLKVPESLTKKPGKPWCVWRFAFEE